MFDYLCTAGTVCFNYCDAPIFIKTLRLKYLLFLSSFFLLGLTCHLVFKIFHNAFQLSHY
jgi:hypothetical protein